MGQLSHTRDRIGLAQWLLYLGLGLPVAGDVYIALSLCILLWKGRTGIHPGTDSIITILTLYTVNTGLLTSVFSLACFISYAVMPSNYVFLAMYFPLSKLYLNAFFATLNARGHVKSFGGGNEDLDTGATFSLARRSGRTSIPIAFASSVERSSDFTVSNMTTSVT